MTRPIGVFAFGDQGNKMQVITANRLGDGRVVYLTASGGWTVLLGDARFLDAAADVAAALAEGQAAAARQDVVDPYPVSVVDGAAGPAPQTLRERIRAFGPTTVPAPEARTLDISTVGDSAGG